MVGIGQLDIGALDGRLVGLDLGRQAGDVGGALIEQLLRCIALLGQRGSTLEILLGIEQAGLILRPAWQPPG